MRRFRRNDQAEIPKSQVRKNTILKVQNSKISISLKFTEDLRMMFLGTPPVRNDVSRRYSRRYHRSRFDLAVSGVRGFTQRHRTITSAQHWH